MRNVLHSVHRVGHSKARTLAALLLWMGASWAAWAASNAPPEIQASAAILVDAATGQVLYERNANARRYPASTTKIMTAILLLEHLPLDTEVAADKEVSETDGSSLYMAPGERIRAEELLYAIMLRSANDACVAVARAIAGSHQAFVGMMNRKAAELGATNTHFANANGLHTPDHYTTARDLARIACYAMQNETFRRVVSTRRRIIQRDPQNQDVYLKNRNKLLWHYPGADGIKTGYTVPAGRCLVGSASRNGWRIISVVLNSPDMFGETRRLLDYGFANFEPVVLMEAGTRVSAVPVTGGGRLTVEAVLDAPLRYVRRRTNAGRVAMRWSLHPQRAPVARGRPVGTIEAVQDGRVVAQGVLRASTAVGAALPPSLPRSETIPRAAGTIAAIVVYWNVSTSSQNTRRRRRGVPTGGRGAHALWEGDGQR